MMRKCDADVNIKTAKCRKCGKCKFSQCRILGTAHHKGKEEKLEKKQIEGANMKRNPQYAML